jgi:hypothetical protein
MSWIFFNMEIKKDLRWKSPVPYLPVSSKIWTVRVSWVVPEHLDVWEILQPLFWIFSRF